MGIAIAISKIEYGNLIRNVLIGAIILNFPFSYNTAFVREYNTGTKEFEEFAKNNINEKEVITTESNDIYHTLPYYLPNNELRWKYITENTKGYVFTDKTFEDMKKLVPNSTIEELFTGDINGTMKFCVYHIK